MSSDGNIERREFLAGIGVAAAGLFAVGCGGGTKRQSACVSTTIADQDRLQRIKKHYVDMSTVADKNCLNCHFYTEGLRAGACGECSQFGGPVHPKGYCDDWKAKA